MKSDGFVLILCLCFIALVSSMALSALLIGLLSQKIGIAGQQQVQQQQWAKALHLQQQKPGVAPIQLSDMTTCPAKLAVWSEPATYCRWIELSSNHQQLNNWSSLMLSTELTLPQEAL
ncbi:MAG: hypothetical protein ACK4NN_02425 [Rheinheimera sp.]